MDKFEGNKGVLRTQSLPRSNLFMARVRPASSLSRAQISLQCECSSSDKLKSNSLLPSSSKRSTRSSSVCSTIADESLGEVVRKFDEVWISEKMRSRNRSVNSSLSSVDGNNFNTSSSLSQRYFIASTRLSNSRNVKSIDCDSMSLDSPSLSPSTPTSNHLSCIFHGCAQVATDAMRFTSWSEKESLLHSSTTNDIKRNNSPAIFNCCSRTRTIVPSNHHGECMFAPETNKGSSYIMRRNSSWTGQMQPLIRDQCPLHHNHHHDVNHHHHHRLSLMPPNCNRASVWCNNSNGNNGIHHTSSIGRANSIEPGSESSSSDSSTSDSRKSYILQAPRSTFTSLNSSLGSSFSGNVASRTNSLRRSSTYSLKGQSNAVSVAVETDRVIKRNASLQVTPETFSRGTKTETVMTKNVACWTRSPSMVHQAIQTDEVNIINPLLAEKSTQATHECKCAKQGELLKETAVDTSDLLPVDSSRSDDTVSQVTESVDEKCTTSENNDSSCYTQQETNVTVLKSSAGDEIIMEEGPDEIVVYKKPPSELCLSLVNGKKHGHSSIFSVSEIEKLGTSETRIYDSSSSSSSNCDEETGNHNAMDEETGERSRRTVCEPSSQSKQALQVIQEYLEKAKQHQEPAFVTNRQIIAEEWFSISSGKNCNSKSIEEYLDAVENMSKLLLHFVVNLTDCSGNTAMHYAISHSNFDAASVLLDSKVCDVNKFNKAGYTSLMLVSIAKITNELEKAVVKRLFSLGDVNLKTKDNGQTALMLAASHGKLTTVKLLLDAGADVNIQDKEGSTALMCAADNGHSYVVKLLLCHFETDVNLTDNDGANALSIAVAAGHKNIGLILYTSSNLLNRASSNYSSLRRSTPTGSPVTDTLSLRRTSSFNSTKALTKFSLINGRKQGL